MADESKILDNTPSENDQDIRDVIDNAKNIIDHASEELITSKSDKPILVDGDTGGSKTIANSFVGLPIETLIGTPFIAAAKAQQELAATYVETVWDLAYGKENSNKDRSNPVNNKVNTLNLTIERPVINEDGKSVSKQSFTVSAPILSLVPIPAFTMDEVVVDFNMEVKNSEVTTEHKNEGVESNLEYKSWWGLSAGIKGNVSADSEHKRETDTSATYKIHARAVQQPPAAGMNKLTDLLTQTMEPIVVPSQHGK